MSLEIKQMVVKAVVGGEPSDDEPKTKGPAVDVESLKRQIVDELKEELKTMLDIRGDR